ncbi:MAG: YrbL family protein [Akkermansiaceae bacterium]
MIELKNLEPFGRGSHRAVYEHPDSPELCIKVMTENWREAGKRQRAPWYVKFLRPKWYFHENLSEHHFAHLVEQRVGEPAWKYLARCHGFVETDLGKGLVVSLVRDHDGRVSMSLADYLLEFGMTGECEKALDYYWEGLNKYLIFARGRPDNVAVQQHEDGSLQIIAIDAFGLSQWIPLAEWIPSEGRKRLGYWREKQERAIAKALELRKSGKHLNDKPVKR